MDSERFQTWNLSHQAGLQGYVSSSLNDSFTISVSKLLCGLGFHVLNLLTDKRCLFLKSEYCISVFSR